MGSKARIEKICAICGDKASGINFNVPSCMSCKTFFRRNALSKKELICQFGDTCKIDVKSRRFCSKCRLKKCFEKGMVKEWILSEDQTERIKYKVRQNRIKKQEDMERAQKLSQQGGNSDQSQGHLSSSSSSPLSASRSPQSSDHSPSPQSVESAQTNHEHLSVLLNSKSESELQNQNNQPIDLNLTDFDLESTIGDYCDQILLENKNMSPIDLTDIDRIFSQVESAQSSLATISPIMSLIQNPEWDYDPILDFIPKYLNPTQKMSLFKHVHLVDSIETQDLLLLQEQNILQELVSAGSVLQSPYKRIQDLNFETSYSSRLTEYFNYRLIQMATGLSAFTRLSRRDQGQILKCSLLRMFSIRTALLYNSWRKSWAFVDDYTKTNVMFRMDFIRPYCLKYGWERMQHFPVLFRDEWKQDNVIFDLLTAIILFTPNIEYSEYAKISEQYNRYIHLLRRYLELKYQTKHEADECFFTLMQIVGENELLTEDVMNFFRSFKTFYYNPFYIKLLDLGAPNSLEMTTQENSF